MLSSGNRQGHCTPELTEAVVACTKPSQQDQPVFSPAASPPKPLALDLLHGVISWWHTLAWAHQGYTPCPYPIIRPFRNTTVVRLRSVKL